MSGGWILIIKKSNELKRTITRRGGTTMTIDEKYFPGFTQKWIETEPGIVINTLIGGRESWIASAL